MELRRFVSTTLKELIEAIADSASFAKEHDAEINPWTLEWQEDQGRILAWDEDTGLYASEVEFDIAITAGPGPANEPSVQVVGFNVSVDGTNRLSEDSPGVSRLRFTVPIVLPTSKPKPAKVMKRA